jgi:hypothetical protein
MRNFLRAALLAPALLFGTFTTAHAGNAGQGSQQSVSPRQQAEESALKFDSALRSLTDVMISTNGYSAQTDAIKHLFDLREANLKIINDLRDDGVEESTLQATFTTMERQFEGSYVAIDTTAGSNGADRLVKRHVEQLKKAFKALKTRFAGLTQD